MINFSTSRNMPSIDVVSLPTAMNFCPRNLLSEIFQFRADQLKKLNWKEGINYTLQPGNPQLYETDLQDTPGTIYFSKSDNLGEIIGTLRLSPSIDANGKNISMLGTTIPHLVDNNIGLPQGNNIYEASRLVLDRDKLDTKEAREIVINELIAATMFFAIKHNIDHFFGFMINKIWESTYERLGFYTAKIGPDTVMQDEDGPEYVVSARSIHFNANASAIARNANVTASILNFGTADSKKSTKYKRKKVRPFVTHREGSVPIFSANVG